MENIEIRFIFDVGGWVYACCVSVDRNRDSK